MALKGPRQVSLMGRIIAGGAEHLAKRWDVPAENREAFIAAAVSIFEQQVCDILGSDSVRLNGWIMLPSQRLARRDRILSALHDGDDPQAIASRELVSVQWVRKIRREFVGLQPDQSA
jgi:hypothetical protein